MAVQAPHFLQITSRMFDSRIRMSNISNSIPSDSIVIEALGIELEILDVLYNTLNALEVSMAEEGSSGGFFVD